MYRIGQGYDAHRLVVGRPLWIGGVEIPFSRGLAGHSDADVLIHALADALLGAAGKGDLGVHFPDSDAAHAGRPSREFLVEIRQLLDASEFGVVNVDATVIAQKPKLADYIPQMRENLACDLQIQAGNVNIKATTTDGLGFTGAEEGIAAQAIVLLTHLAGQ
jgi:2-C-methyl-D-erythritol 2,4-cyclodiphosphate synthase